MSFDLSQVRQSSPLILARFMGLAYRGSDDRNRGLADRPESWAMRRSLVSILVVMGLCLTGTLPALLAAQEEQPSHDSEIEETPLTDSDRDHWSFKKLVTPAFPELSDAPPPASRIDAYIQAKLESKQLESVPLANRRALIRRLYFDLIGLPPDPEEVQRFEQDTRPDAVERLVDRLLASPSYGEHYAQRWLDLARFAETDGFEHDKVRPEAWRYRDWVIQALNVDMGYDRFISLQLAGDELEPEDPQAQLATAFCLAGPDMPDINSQEERRHYLLNGMTANLGSVVMGLQLGCAQCHDHKFDPISQADFYRMRSVFEPAVHVQKDKSVNVLSEPPDYDQPSYLRIRGDWNRRGAEIQPAFLRIANPLGDDLNTLATSLDVATSGRRSALAEWLTQPDHPLTTRVIANRLWQYHFGFGLCRSASDFGYMGDSPTHPRLLDWLATELPRQDWSMKILHRQIVTTDTYQRAGHPAGADGTRDFTDPLIVQFTELFESDRRNYYLARYPRRRLFGETLRDSLLEVSGSLNSQQGGGGIRPPLPDELQSELLRGQWKETEDPSQHRRRSVYIFARRNLRLPIFDSFDRPDANESCARRYQSTTALQSLQLMNSEFATKIARRLALRLQHESLTDFERIDRLFWLTLSRPPTASEQTRIREFLELGDESNRDDRWTNVCLAILNTNEFLYID